MENQTMPLAIEVKDLYCSAKGKKILQGVSLQVKQGEILGLLGPNGAGKTSLIRLICGLGPWQQGEIYLMGEKAERTRTDAQKAMLGLVPQENNLEKELTIYESIYCYGELYGLKDIKDQTEALIQKFHMEEWREKKPRQLSGGMQRRATIARASLPDPKILILDEPTVGLDPAMRQEVWQQVQMLKEAGTTILLTTHYMEEAELLCDRISFLKEGRVLLTDTAAGIKHRVMQDKGTLEDAYLSLVTGEGRQK
ncbi:MAG: ABC transporter ATP-binding protein [Anaerovibrio sp.]|nr:ABC transporter ATP-binding protein [Selenomonadaceae bacterium]MDY6053656.1 ABC transporter ATP-binding protein [Anaerovibrio sp.]